MSEYLKQKIIFYDGDCGFCNRSVQFALDHERDNELHFCALQSNTAKDFFEQLNLNSPDLSTFYFWDGKVMSSKSSGALRLLKEMRFPWNLLHIFKIVPKLIRDKVYDYIAKRRHRISNGYCNIPSVHQKKRFIQDS